MTWRQTFDTRRKLAGALEEGGAGAGFFGEGAGEVGDAGEDVEFGAGEAGFDAEGGCLGVAGADGLTGRGSFEDDDGGGFELGAEAEHGLGGKFAGVEAGIEGVGHLRPAFCGCAGRTVGRTVQDQGVRVCQWTWAPGTPVFGALGWWMEWSLWGGLRRAKSTRLVLLAKRSRVMVTRFSAPVKTVVESDPESGST